MASVSGFFRRRIIDPLLALLRLGITPEKLSWSIALGCVVGIIPVLGISTIITAILALWLRLNLAAIQLVNYLMSPLQLVLIIPFLRLGEWIVGAAPQPMTVSAGLELLQQGVFNAVVILWDAIIHATVGWLIVAPAATYLLYRILVVVLRRAAGGMATKAANGSEA